ncbi:MAG: glycosyltransferase family 2 protein [Bacteroidales bacterium]|jgi:dolichol-phosphate mannosyltransferase|nr:glycosyltransferase family 2 protein [Bacteroidales bacterium]MDD4214094.1 glycosyltransferase family 2 protein [Bacteroidales bacterium]
MKISVILPVFNEGDNIIPMYHKLKEVIAPSGLEPEFVFINDGSTDGSYSIIKNLSLENRNVKFVNFSRNFGHQAALTAGLDYASGDAVITMDCDFQDPPELIPEMIKKWQEGNEVVYTRRKQRKDGFFKTITAKLYYKIIYWFSEFKIHGNVGDFRLLGKKALAEINKMREKSRYLRGMVPWIGFQFAILDYERPLRIHGKTGYKFLQMFRLGMNGLLSFSLAPIRFGLIAGFFIIFSGIGFLIYMFFNYMINDQFYKLLEWMAVVNYILIGFLLIMIWIIAEYIGKIFNETKNRPIYIINDTGNIENIK